MASDVERILGEVNGTLKNHVVPALERQEKRQLEIEKTVAEIRTDLKNLRKDQDDFEKRCEDHWERLYKDVKEKDKQLVALEKDVAGLKKKDDSHSRNWWDVTKIIIASLVSAVVGAIIVAVSMGGKS